MDAVGRADLLHCEGIAGTTTPPAWSAAAHGMKTMGLALLPLHWRLPFAVVPTLVFERWLSAPKNDRSEILREVAAEIVDEARGWLARWPAGLILRSSTTTETLNDRGSHHSPKLPGDYSLSSIAAALEEMYESHNGLTSSSLAVLVQPLLGRGRFGHLSNERRVSKTVNQWEWEQQHPDRDTGRANSQRHRPPPTEQPLAASGQDGFLNSLKSVGCWVVSLKRGPAHLEWAWVDGCLLLLQIDFEDDSPDDGVDPSDWQRSSDHEPSRNPPPGSVFERVSYGAELSKWKKIENTRVFAEERTEPFPILVTLTGNRLTEAQMSGSDLASQLSAIAGDRVVCRTDTVSTVLPRTNLPRTNTVTAADAVKAMTRILAELCEKTARPDEVCFILHKFIPARVGAWARADPNEQIVRVDSLWGVPDGLQYLPHDTFEYDVRNQVETAERVRYKPRFVQEVDGGAWQELRVMRRHARHRSLSSSDVREVAQISHRIACRRGKPQLIMWFCSIPDEINIGRNLAWFSMDAAEGKLLHDASREHLRHRPRLSVRSSADLDEVARSGIQKHILVLEPEVDFIRDDERFLKRAIALATSQDLVIELAGSILSHAYFELDRSGVVVILADEASHSRTRRRQDFRKLVRDNIPAKIENKGEAVVQTQLPRSELRRALVAKLFEEGQELLAAREAGHVREELADLLEVVKGIAAATGVEWGQVEEAAAKKHDERGGFEAGVVLMETSLPSPHKSGRRALAATSLQDLGRVTAAPEAVSVSFNALVAAGSKGTEVRVPGDTVRVALSPDGIVIRAAEEPAQMHLPLFGRDD